MPEKLSDEEIIKIQSLHDDKKMNIPQISEETGRPLSTIDKYIKAERLKPPMMANVPKEENKEPIKVGLEEVKEPATPIESPYPDIPEPDKWLETFLKGYGLNPPFVQGQCARVKRRNALPTPADLMADLQAGGSGQKNVLMIRDIVEDYDFVVEEYLKQRESQLNLPYVRRRGIPVRQPTMPQMQSKGIPLRNQPQPQYDIYGQAYAPQPQYDTYGQPIYYDQREGIPLNPPQQGGYQMTLAQQLRDIVEVNRLLQGTQQQTNPQMEEMRREMAEMRRQNEERQQREILSTKDQLQREYQEKQQIAQAYREMEEKLRMAEMNLQFEKTNKRTTVQDVQMKEIDTKYNIENRKLEESGKSRDTWAKAIESGLGQVGQVVARTIQALGSDERMPMTGMTDMKGNMWESECPYCQTPITAPLSANMIQCPGCGKRLEVTGEQPPEKFEPRVDLQHKNFEPSPPYIPPKETERPRISECPFCRAALTLPPGADLVECPNCNKRLRVVPETPPISMIPEKAPTKKSIEGEHVYIDKEIFPMEAPLEKREELPIEVEEPMDDVKPLSEEALKKSDEPHLVQSGESLEGEIEKGKELEELRQRNEEENKKRRERALKKAEENINKPFIKDGYTMYETASKSGQPFYFFARKSDKGKPCTEIPDGYEVGKNPRSGVPTLKKVKK